MYNDWFIALCFYRFFNVSVVFHPILMWFSCRFSCRFLLLLFFVCLFVCLFVSCCRRCCFYSFWFVVVFSFAAVSNNITAWTKQTRISEVIYALKNKYNCLTMSSVSFSCWIYWIDCSSCFSSLFVFTYLMKTAPSIVRNSVIKPAEQ